MSSPTLPERRFLNPEAPLLESLVPALLERESLEDWLVMVPTAHSGRRLREALPRVAGRPVLAPQVLTPDAAFRPSEDSPAAPRLTWWAAWSEVVRSVPPSELEALFPDSADLTRDASWGLATAKAFTRLKDELAEVDRDFADVAELNEDDPARWQCLAKLDEKVKARLKHWSLMCPAEAKRNSAVHWSAPEGCRGIILAAVPDAVPLALRAWRNALGEIPVISYIHASDEQADQFDAWGRPLADFWCHAQIDLPGPQEEVITLCRDAEDLSEQVLAGCQNHANTAIALGVIDRAFAAKVSEGFEQAGWRPFDPDGRPLSSTGLWVLFQQLRKLVANPRNFSEVPALLKCPAAQALFPSLRSPFKTACQVDQLLHRHLPQTLHQARELASPTLLPILDELAAWLEKAFKLEACQWLTELIDHLSLSPHFPEELASPAAQALEALSQLSRHLTQLSLGEALDLFLGQLESARLKGSREGSAINQLGWLELAYENAPHLLLAAVHEGIVPDRPGDDAFLTESLRTRLGLRSRQDREARDAYLLDSFIKARLHQGSTRIFVAQNDQSGTPRQASKLLLRCAEEELASRVQHCFQEDLGEPPRVPAYARGDWHLQIPAELSFQAGLVWTLSPSLLADYLRCPLRFYLKRELKFQRSEFDKQELDAADFGELLHRVLEQFGRDPSLKDLSDEDEIRRALEQLLEDEFAASYQNSEHLALTIQKASARRRLAYFARHQAATRAAGWVIEAVELKIGPEPDRGETPWNFAGQPVRMRIDRIDRHEETGTRRLIDYKSGKATRPANKHLTNHREEQDGEFCYGELLPPQGRQKSPRRWTDLQLPLYAEYARQQWGELPEIAYAQLPPTAADCGFDLWHDYHEEIHNCAMEWVHGVADAIRAGHFPERKLPAGQLSWDPFADLAPDSLAAALGKLSHP